MRTVSLFIKIIIAGNYEYKRVDLFNDEKITITSSIQNISDIDKVFSDYSQTFSVPASANNNKIFNHWYNNDVDNGYDSRVRYNGFIAVDGVQYKFGLIQLEKATKKDGMPYSYSIAFFGAMVSLKDSFKEEMLSQVNLSSYDIPYSATEVVNRISTKPTTDYNVKFPLISQKRYWIYDNTNNSNNIHKTTGAIYYNELFPALRLSSLFNAISTTYGITFTGNFLINKRFTNAFLYLKNAEIFKVLSSKLVGQIDGFTTPQTEITANTSTDTFTYITGGEPHISSALAFQIRTATIGSIATIYVYKDANLISETLITLATTNFYTVEVFNDTIFDGLKNGEYQVQISINSNINYDVKYIYCYNEIDPDTGMVVNNCYDSAIVSQTSASTLNIKNYVPEIKVLDFIKGVLKQFNLTCYSEVQDIYIIQELEDWYATGKDINLDKYINDSELTFERVKQYKQINFKYEKSENIISKLFAPLNNNIEYGDLIYTNPAVDGGNYEIKLPFEDLMFQKFTGTNLCVAYCIKSDFNSYVPKPIILYDYDVLQTTGVDFHLDTLVGSPTNLFAYNMFGAETNVSGNIYSLNWGIEQSIYSGILNQNSLYALQYSQYLNNFYFKKSRIFKAKGNLPISILQRLKLNSTVIIKNDRYIINNLNIDVTNGDVSFDLLTDFRPLKP